MMDVIVSGTDGLKRTNSACTVADLNAEAAGAAAPTSTSSVDVLALDEALDALSSFDVRQCRVVELPVLCRAQHP